MNKPKRLFAGGALLAMLSGTVHAEYGLNLPVGVTETSQQIYDLHMLILWICVAIGVVVFGAMIWSMIHHRKSKGATASQFHESMTIELVWTILPFVILIAMAVPATKVLIAMDDSSESEMSIKVTGYQWKWRYEYLDEGIDFFSTLDAKSNEVRQLGSGLDPEKTENYLLDVDKRLVIPADTKIRFLLTASDVIHSWWVPDFGWKKDAVPGFVNEAWTKVSTPGVYRGQCAELCGRDHGFMPIVVEVLSKEDYAVWAAEQTGGAPVAVAAVSTTEVTEAGGSAPVKAAAAAIEPKAVDGKAVYNTHCAACHQANGQGVPGMFPAIAGSAIATGDVAAHIALVLNGKSGSMMPAFGPQLGDAELAAVITYQRNAFGNDTGDTVAPADVAAAR